MKHRFFRAAAALLLLLSLSGCFGIHSAEELYCLPQIPGYLRELQAAVDLILEDGAEYAPPICGEHRQSVQLEDIDCDGEKEVVCFFRRKEAELPLMLCIFRQSGESYVETFRLNMEGNGFDQVFYSDLNGDGTLELVVGRQLGTELKMLSVYTVNECGAACLFQADYIELAMADLTRNGRDDITVIRPLTEVGCCEAETFTVTEDGDVTSSRTRLSRTAGELERVRITRLSNGAMGVVAETGYNSGLVTDILAWRYGGLSNITVDTLTGVSDSTVRSAAIYSADINGDGVIDVPQTVAMPQIQEGTVYYRTVWYNYSTYGQVEPVMTTYHNYSDGWYLALDDSWAARITVRREDTSSGERTVVFSVTDGEDTVLYDWLRISAFTGEGQEERATQGGGFLLHSDGLTTYTAQLLPGSTGYIARITPQEILDRFHIIYSDWETGELS